ncbi:MAG: 5-deoxy-glucuronate isomerase [Verrucomicrobiae bacterium]|nr:5-deoxy-glucuronate isomerase [Verrucomicrobiae bacterium]
MPDPAAAPEVKPAHLLKAGAAQFEYRQRSNPRTTNLDMLAYGTFHAGPGAVSDEFFHRAEEAILFCLEGACTVELDEGNGAAPRAVKLDHYDTLYLPRETAYRLVNESADAPAMLAVCRAPAENRHAVHHARWEEIRRDESRIRHLNQKDVFLMFDVSEGADKLIAGYTIYEPHTRAWPPHNHTDQEEVYIFTKGRGSMEVYPDEEHKTFVYSVDTMDAVTIPLLNYHPVFSQEEELHFIWCLCGERYWVGDKHKAFMDASVDSLTT